MSQSAAKKKASQAFACAALIWLSNHFTLRTSVITIQLRRRREAGSTPTGVKHLIDHLAAANL